MHRFLLALIILPIVGCTTSGSNEAGDDAPGWAKPLVAVVGRSASGPVFDDHVPPRAKNAVLYLYRPTTYVNSAHAPHVYIDGEQYAQLLNAGYQRHELKPGRHQIVTDGFWLRKLTIEIEVTTGEVVYVRLDSHADAFGATTSLVRVDKGTGETEIRRTKLSN